MSRMFDIRTLHYTSFGLARTYSARLPYRSDGTISSNLALKLLWQVLLSDTPYINLMLRISAGLH